MDIAQFKETLIETLKNDVAFRHQVLNILQSDLEGMLDVDTYQKGFDDPICEVTVRLNPVSDEETREDIMHMLFAKMRGDFEGVFSHFSVAQRRKKESCRKDYVQYIKSGLSDIDTHELQNFYNDITLRISALANTKSTEKRVKSHEFFTNLKRGDYDKELENLVI